MITISIPITLSAEDRDFIVGLQKMQSPMIRTAYNQSKWGVAEISVRKEVRDRFEFKGLDSWFMQSAVKSGVGMAKADEEIGVKTRIFGGRNNMKRRAKGLITNADWKKLRLAPIYLIGEAPQKGNRKFTFLDDKIIFKPWKGKSIEISVPNLHKNWKRKYLKMVEMAQSKKIPVTVSLTSETINITFKDLSLAKYPKPIEDRYAGIDLNPNYIGVSVFQSGVLVETKLFCLKELTGKNSSASKLQHETREIAHNIGSWLKHLRVKHVFSEELSFKQGNKGFGKNFNRLTQNQWKRSDFNDTLSKYFKLYKVNAAYSSTIGNVMNPSLPDPIAASCEIARRGFEVIIVKNKRFYPSLPSKTYLEDHWKETEIPDFRSWIELHSWLKDTKMRYRVPIPEMDKFRLFSSRRTSVGVL